MDSPNTLLFTGTFGLLYTDVNGVTYRVSAKKHLTRHCDMVMFSDGITTADGYYVTDTEKKRIVLKILSLTQGVRWLIR